MLRTGLIPAVALALAGAVTLPAEPADAADIAVNEVYSRPADGVYAVEGHGWGHGRGMSQWGAQGAAKLGRTADQITAFYYKGTTKQVIADSEIRVLLSNDEGKDTRVFPASGLTATDVATGAKLVLPSGPTQWRAIVDAAGLHLQGLDSGTWKQQAIGGRTAFAGPLRFSGSTFVRLVYPDGTSRDYRGAVQAVKTSSTTLQSVGVLGLEDYLLGVVPRESASSWHAAALQSQAIAARSYSAFLRASRPATATYHICDTTQCQVFGGSAMYTASGTRTNLEPASTTEAVRATKGVVRAYEGAPIFAEYSSSNGGWSTAGSRPYLVAQRDDWDGVVPNSVHSWTASLRVTDLERRYPALGTLVRMRVTKRDGNGEWGGRVREVVLEGRAADGTATSVRTTGAGVYNARPWPANGDGLKSSWWHITSSVSSQVVAQSTAPRLVKPPGASTGTLTASLRNTGAHAWPVSGLHLAVSSPPGEADPLVGGSTRPGELVRNADRPGASTIEPGEVADFRFALDAAGVGVGTHGRAYRLRIGTGDVFGATVSWQIPVDAPLFTAEVVGRAEPVSTTHPPVAGADAPPAVFPDGKTVVVPRNGATTLRITVRNTGNVTWPVGPTSPVMLGTSGPRDRTSPSRAPSWIAPNRPSRIDADADVAPGQTGTFDLTLAGNALPVGVTTEAFEPVWIGKHWLDGAQTSFNVVRFDPAVPRSAALHSAPPALVRVTNAPGSSQEVVVRLRNLGGTAWKVGEERLAASAGFPYTTPAWASATRPPALHRNASRPGVASVHPGEVGEWRIPVSGSKKAPGKATLVLQATGPTGAYGPRVTTTVEVVKAVITGQLVRVAPRVTVPRAGTAVTWFDVKNTGNSAWPVGSAVRSVALQTGGSPSRASSWLTPTRPAALTNNVTRAGAPSVGPGEVGRFRVVLAGNRRTAAPPSEPFGVIWEGVSTTTVRAALAYVLK